VLYCRKRGRNADRKRRRPCPINSQSEMRPVPMRLSVGHPPVFSGVAVAEPNMPRCCRSPRQPNFGRESTPLPLSFFAKGLSTCRRIVCDDLCSLALSTCVYKSVDISNSDSTAARRGFQSSLCPSASRWPSGPNTSVSQTRNLSIVRNECRRDGPS